MINYKTLRALLHLSDPDHRAMRKIARTGMSEEMMKLQWDREKLPKDLSRPEPDFGRIWLRIDSDTRDSQSVNRSIRTFRLPVLIRYAAVILIAALAFVGGRLSTDSGSSTAETLEYTTHRGLRSQLTLPDGSTVWLNAGSRVTYGEQFGLTHRDLQIEGEAVFRVKKDGDLPFRVSFGENRLTALGTEFTVSAYDFNEHSVAGLIEGSVLLERGLNQRIIDRPLTVEIDRKTGEFSSRPLQSALYSWKDGELIFEDTPLREMGHRLSNWYNQDVIVEESVAAERFTMKITGESLEEVLTLIDLASEVGFKAEGNGYRLFPGR